MFNADHFHASPCWPISTGLPVWVGAPNATSDHISAVIGAGQYYIAWVPTDCSSPAVVTMTAALTFHPAPPAWL
ncbi:MAG: hypothetical protein L3K15_06335 [Thermoplasmata archaeon]|nr:hypothetical protein [Thermoplasmata archaeon]